MSGDNVKLPENSAGPAKISDVEKEVSYLGGKYESLSSVTDTLRREQAALRDKAIENQSTAALCVTEIEKVENRVTNRIVETGSAIGQIGKDLTAVASRCSATEEALKAQQTQLSEVKKEVGGVHRLYVTAACVLTVLIFFGYRSWIQGSELEEQGKLIKQQDERIHEYEEKLTQMTEEAQKKVSEIADNEARQAIASNLADLKFVSASGSLTPRAPLDTKLKVKDYVIVIAGFAAKKATIAEGGVQPVIIKVQAVNKEGIWQIEANFATEKTEEWDIEYVAIPRHWMKG